MVVRGWWLLGKILLCLLCAHTFLTTVKLLKGLLRLLTGQALNLNWGHWEQRTLRSAKICWAVYNSILPRTEYQKTVLKYKTLHDEQFNNGLQGLSVDTLVRDHSLNSKPPYSIVKYWIFLHKVCNTIRVYQKVRFCPRMPALGLRDTGMHCHMWNASIDLDCEWTHCVLSNHAANCILDWNYSQQKSYICMQVGNIW